MPGTTVLQLYSYPTTADQASPASIQTLAQSVERQVVAVFADAATRDSRWTAATGITNGAMCFLLSTGELELRSGGAWIVIGGRQSSFAMAEGTAGYALANVASITVTITFPTNRFSLAPVVFAGHQSAGGGTQALTMRPFNITNVSCSLAISHNAGTLTTVTGETYAWQAYQMTAVSAVG